MSRIKVKSKRLLSKPVNLLLYENRKVFFECGYRLLRIRIFKNGGKRTSFCPRLYSAMRGREKMKPISVTPCEWACRSRFWDIKGRVLQARKGLKCLISLAAKPKANCPICGGQLTFEKNSGENRFIRLKVSADDEQ